MKKIIFILGILFLFATACKESTVEKPTDALKDHNMKIIPENPTSNDVIRLVILDDCTYNILSELDRKGKQIDITKQFNSMMKWPCFEQNDTILIGKLPADIYTVNYKLMDLSTEVTNHVSMSFSFMLKVER